MKTNRLKINRTKHCILIIKIIKTACQNLSYFRTPTQVHNQTIKWKLSNTFQSFFRLELRFPYSTVMIHTGYEGCSNTTEENTKVL